MIEHIWTVACRETVVDKRTNNASLLNILEQLTVHDEPKPDGMIGLAFDVVTLWIRADSDVPCYGSQRILIVDPTGQVIGEFELEIDLRKTERTRNIFRFQGLRARIPGRYHFRVELHEEGETEWRFIDQVPLSVAFSPPPSQEPVRDEPVSAQP